MPALAITAGIVWLAAAILALVWSASLRLGLEKRVGELERGRVLLLDRAEAAEKLLDEAKDILSVDVERRKLLDDARRIAERAIEEAHEQRLRAFRYFACIRGIESERDEWKGIAGENVSLYAGGLDVALAEIQRLSHIARTEVNPVFEGIVHGYRKREEIVATPPPAFDAACPVAEYEARVEDYVGRHEKKRMEEEAALGPPASILALGEGVSIQDRVGYPRDVLEDEP